MIRGLLGLCLITPALVGVLFLTGPSTVAVLALGYVATPLLIVLVCLATN
jgi:hypothetical protein